MPINYQAPSPAGSVYQRAASNFNAADASIIGHEEALGMQQTLQNQRLLFQGGQEAQMEAARVQAAAAMQDRHAELQVWMHGQEMTQAEQMQLKQDQNAVAWINSQRGKSLSDQQADDAIAQRVAKINLGQQRAQAQQLKLHAEQTAHVKAQTDVQNAIYHSMNSAADDKRAVVIDKDFTHEAEVYANDLGLDPASPEGDAAMKRFAVKSGRAVTGWTQKDGSIKPDTAPKGAAAGGEAGGQTNAAHHQASFESAMKLVATMAKEKNAEGGAVHPELQTTEGRIEEAKKIADASQGFVSEKLGAGHREKIAEVQKTQSNFAQSELDKLYTLPPGVLTPEQHATAGQAMASIRDIIGRYGPYESLDTKMKKRVDDLRSAYKRIAGPAIERFGNAKKGAEIRSVMEGMMRSLGGGGSPQPAAQPNAPPPDSVPLG